MTINTSVLKRIKKYGFKTDAIAIGEQGIITFIILNIFVISIFMF